MGHHLGIYLGDEFPNYIRGAKFSPDGHLYLHVKGIIIHTGIFFDENVKGTLTSTFGVIVTKSGDAKLINRSNLRVSQVSLTNPTKLPYSVVNFNDVPYVILGNRLISLNDLSEIPFSYSTSYNLVSNGQYAFDVDKGAIYSLNESSINQVLLNRYTTRSGAQGIIKGVNFYAGGGLVEEIPSNRISQYSLLGPRNSIDLEYPFYSIQFLDYENEVAYSNVNSGLQLDKSLIGNLNSPELISILPEFRCLGTSENFSLIQLPTGEICFLDLSRMAWRDSQGTGMVINNEYGKHLQCSSLAQVLNIPVQIDSYVTWVPAGKYTEFSCNGEILTDSQGEIFEVLNYSSEEGSFSILSTSNNTQLSISLDENTSNENKELMILARDSEDHVLMTINILQRHGE